ncbi:MAG: hypothetical protein V2I33_10445 [Kangiellaceae bacterium]|nr:hypothetical protein [Kangiellaceae bacterium]
MKQFIISSLFVTASFIGGDAFAGDIDKKLQAAMKSDIRTEAEVKRDRNRRPLQTLNFFGLKDDMKILEIMPGGGWYTKLLAPIVADNGEYFAAFGTNTIESRLVGKPGFKKMNIIEGNNKLRYDKGYILQDIKISENNFDIVFTFRNYHSFKGDGRMRMNKAAFDALKPGGVYAVVGHTRRHMEPDNPENGRRFDPVKVIKEVQAAGFKFEDFSSLHYRADDELRYEVGRKTVTGNTDRFTLKFRKPK